MVSRNQIGSSECARPFNGLITPPLRGVACLRQAERLPAAGSAAAQAGGRQAEAEPIPELVEGVSKGRPVCVQRTGRRRLMRWGDVNAVPYASIATKYNCILRGRPIVERLQRELMR